MQQNNAVRDSRTTLTFDERTLLEVTILPTARRWVAEYPAGSSLHGHGMSTLTHWGEGQ